jgi:hypothetical protein
VIYTLPTIHLISIEIEPRLGKANLRDAHYKCINLSFSRGFKSHTFEYKFCAPLCHIFYLFIFLIFDYFRGWLHSTARLYSSCEDSDGFIPITGDMSRIYLLSLSSSSGILCFVSQSHQIKRKELCSIYIL